MQLKKETGILKTVTPYCLPVHETIYTSSYITVYRSIHHHHDWRIHMARLDKMPENERSHLLSLPCPTFESTPWVTGPSLNKRRLALISTAGLQRRSDLPFDLGASDYRVIPSNTLALELIMSHISTNFDRTGFQQDLNVVFPIDRLNELVEGGVIGSLATYHYSFMGATDPAQLEGSARSLARIMKNDGVDAVLLVPV